LLEEEAADMSMSGNCKRPYVVSLIEWIPFLGTVYKELKGPKQGSFEIQS